MPRWHPISISGYHIREAGSTAAQELAFTLKDGFTYVEQAVARGLDVDEFAPRLSFFFNAQIDFFEEIAKYRAARRIWARELRDTFGARKTGVVADALPHPDRRRVADRAAAAQQHRPHGDRGARRRARRHPVAAHQLLRRGARAADRGGGPDRAAHAADHRPRDRRREHDRSARRCLLRRGADRPAWSSSATSTSTGSTSSAGWSQAVKDGFPQREIADAAFTLQREIDAGRRIVVGVNASPRATTHETPILRIDPALERKQVERLRAAQGRPRRRGRPLRARGVEGGGERATAT